VKNVEIVGPQVGKQLQNQANGPFSIAGRNADLPRLSLRMDLWRSCVLTVFHDTLITVGAFSLTNKEISLTVIAAILTLIGIRITTQSSYSTALQRI